MLIEKDLPAHFLRAENAANLSPCQIRRRSESESRLDLALGIIFQLSDECKLQFCDTGWHVLDLIIVVLEADAQKQDRVKE